MNKIVIAILFSVALGVVGLGFYNTYRLGVTSAEKKQAERKADVVEKQRDIGARRPAERDVILELMFDDKF